MAGGGQEDAAQTAIAYGKVNQAVYAAYTAASQFLNMAHPDLRIRPDFGREEGEWELEVRGRVAPVFVLAALIKMAVGLLRLLIKRRGNQPSQRRKPTIQPSTGGDTI